MGITEQKAVNIIGFNHPVWAITFYGSIMSNVMPVGIYTTNTAESCLYVSEHSNCELLVAEDMK